MGNHCNSRSHRRGNDTYTEFGCPNCGDSRRLRFGGDTDHYDFCPRFKTWIDCSECKTHFKVGFDRYFCAECSYDRCVTCQQKEIYQRQDRIQMKRMEKIKDQ